MSPTGRFPRDYPRFLRFAGRAAWFAVGLPVLTSWTRLQAAGTSPRDYGAWIAAFLLFGIAFASTTSAGRFERDLVGVGALALIASQAAAVIALAALPPCYGLEGALLVLVAIQLAGPSRRRRAFSGSASSRSRSSRDSRGRLPPARAREAKSVRTDFPALETPDSLTSRKREVLRLVAVGHSNREIARALSMAEGTVTNNVSSILSKLGVRDRTRAVLMAVKAGELE